MFFTFYLVNGSLNLFFSLTDIKDSTVKLPTESVWLTQMRCFHKDANLDWYKGI